MRIVDLETRQFSECIPCCLPACCLCVCVFVRDVSGVSTLLKSRKHKIDRMRFYSVGVASIWHTQSVAYRTKYNFRMFDKSFWRQFDFVFLYPIHEETPSTSARLRKKWREREKRQQKTNHRIKFHLFLFLSIPLSVFRLLNEQIYIHFSFATRRAARMPHRTPHTLLWHIRRLIAVR